MMTLLEPTQRYDMRELHVRDFLTSGYGQMFMILWVQIAKGFMEGVQKVGCVPGVILLTTKKIVQSIK